jgi:hypothetical protein
MHMCWPQQHTELATAKECVKASQAWESRGCTQQHVVHDEPYPPAVSLRHASICNCTSILPFPQPAHSLR